MIDFLIDNYLYGSMLSLLLILFGAYQLGKSGHKYTDGVIVTTAIVAFLLSWFYLVWHILYYIVSSFINKEDK